MRNTCKGFMSLLHPAEQDVVRRCLEAVAESDDLAELAVGKWQFTSAKFFSGDEVVERYKSGGINREQWYPPLKSAVSGRRQVCVIVLENHDRRGLEHLPPHVLGRVGTFFVDVDTLKVAHVMTSIYMT